MRLKDFMWYILIFFEVSIYVYSRWGRVCVSCSGAQGLNEANGWKGKEYRIVESRKENEMEYSMGYGLWFIGYEEGKAEIENEPILIFPSSPLVLVEITMTWFSIILSVHPN